MAGLILAMFPTLAVAEAGPAADTGTDDVLVLELTDVDGDPTTLVEEEAGASAQMFRAQSSSVMTKALDVPEFSVAGVTWHRDDAPQGPIELRVRSADGWTAWHELEPDLVDEGETGGTEPFIVGSGTGVQVRIDSGNGTLPESLELHLIPPNPSDNDVRAADVEELADVDVTESDEQDPAPAPSHVEEPSDEPAVELTEEPTDELTDPAPTPEAPTAPDPTPTSEAPTAPDDADEPEDVETEQPTDTIVFDDAPNAPAAPEPSIDGAAFSGADAPVITTAAMTTTVTPEIAPAAVVAPVLPTAPARPSIISRERWNADDSRQIWNVELEAAVIHHTAGSNNYTRSQSAGIVRGIQRYHMGGLGWPDVGYNFLVDKYGQVFEGRRGSMNAPPGQMPKGAHAKGYNAGTLGISVLGDYSSLRAPDIAIRRMEEVIAWKFHGAQIDMDTTSGFISPGTAARPAGQRLARIFGHRDVRSTTCPGNNIYARIPAMMTRVKRLIGPLGDGNQYHLHNRLEGGEAALQFRYARPTDTILVGDWNGDGKDTFAIRRGDTYYVRNSLDDSTRATTFKYGRPDDVVLVGDWNGDGKDTFAVRRGDEYHIRNSLTGGKAHVRFHYGRPNDVVLVGDWDGDGEDTLAVRRDHEYHIRNSLTGGKADVIFKYGRPADQVLVGDWNGNGRDTLSVRRGRTYYVQNQLRGGKAEREFIYGWTNDVTLVGDWDGDDRDTFGVRRH